MNSKITKKFKLTRKFLISLIIIVIPKTIKIIIIKILIFLIFRDYFQWIIIVTSLIIIVISTTIKIIIIKNLFILNFRDYF